MPSGSPLTVAFLRGFRPRPLLSLLLLLLVPGLIWLGLWQLDRAEQRRALGALQQAQREARPLPLARLDEVADPAYRRIRLQGRFDAGHSLLLDNRSRDGRVGVELLQPFHDAPSGRWVLVNRGWLPWPDRQVPPVFETPPGPLALTAWVHVPPDTPFPRPLYPGEGWPKRIQRVALDEVWALLGRNGVGYELRLESGAAAYRADWPTSGMTPGRHLGYALQWFACAAALVLLWVYLGFRPSDDRPAPVARPPGRQAPG